MSRRRRAVRQAAVVPLRLYRLMLSPLMPRSCRFEPTCSAYAIDAILQHGVARGGWLATQRLARCQPTSLGGHDPVPTAARR